MKRSHEQYMSRCIKLANVALQKGDSPVGAIIVHDEQIIGKGIESGKSTGDITNHAEILAVREAISNGKLHLLKKAKMYTTHEPCIMCSYMIRHYKIPHVIYGVSVDFVGGFTSQFDILSTEEVPNWGKNPEVISGICETECQHLTEQFFNSQIKNND